MGLMTRWTDGEREAPEPLEGNVVATVVTGTLVWLVLFLAQLPFYGWYDDHGHAWWIWTCAAGAGLGLVGLWYVRRREASLRRGAGVRTRDEGDGGPADGGSAGSADGADRG